MFSKFDELEDIVRENTILIKKNRALVSINHDNLHNAYRESYDVTRELLLLQLERARKFIVESQNKKDVFEAQKKGLKSNLIDRLILDESKISDIINSINEIAPEHLEVNISKPDKIINKIINVGSVCIGKYSPMAVTDYNAGTNHVLPTFGSAKFASGLNVNEF